MNLLDQARARLPQRYDVFAKFLELDDRLVAKSYPPTSPWWRTVLGGFYASGKWQFVPRVGRRGGKSSTLCRIAVCEALWGGHKVPPGDVGVVAIVSISKAQASERIRTIQSILEAIGMKLNKHYRRTGDTIELVGRPIKFETFSATRGASVGFTGICIICDEVALWRNEETGANPAEEILAWLRPTIATQPNAKMYLSSSPFSTLDAHHEAFERGDTIEQMVAYAPTWIANPTLSEARTHELEPDRLEWLRQYKAEPVSAGTVNFFDTNAIDDAVDDTIRLPRTAFPGDIVTFGADFGFRSDSSALAVCHRTDNIYRIADLLELRPTATQPLKPSLVVEEFARIIKAHGGEYLMADGHYRQAISEHLEHHDLQFTIAPQGQTGIADSFVRARVLLHGSQLRLPRHEGLIRQLKQVISKPTAGGALSISQPRKAGGGHGDLVSASILAIWQRSGTEISSQQYQFGTPEYYQWYHSAEASQRREDAVQEREAEMLVGRGSEIDELIEKSEQEWWER